MREKKKGYGETYFNRDQCNRGKGCWHCNLGRIDRLLWLGYKTEPGPYNVRFTIGNRRIQV